MLGVVSFIMDVPGRGFMRGVVRWMWKRNRPVTLGIVLCIVGVKITSEFKKRQRRHQWDNAGKDVVILHCLGKGIYTPSLSPFVMKLATYLRLAQISHQVDFTEPFGPKGKSPWITINGRSMGDSQLVMEYLGKHFNKDFSSQLTEEQKAVSWTFALMMDEHICWGLRDWRWVLDWGREIIRGSNIPPLMKWLVKWLVILPKRRQNIKALQVQGLGKHTHEEIKHFVTKDLEAVSKYLGNKPFLMGDEPSEVDCSVFGCLVQVKYNFTGSPYTDMLEREFANVGTYVIRMKERLWPDWDQCLATPHRR